MPALLHLPDGRIRTRQRFALVESGAHGVWRTPGKGTRGNGMPPEEASAEAKLERASSACRHAEGVKVAARNLLAEPRSEGNEEAYNTLVSKFPSEDHAVASAAAVAAVLASATEVEDRKAPPWRPDDE